jgi:hypothetical protein
MKISIDVNNWILAGMILVSFFIGTFFGNGVAPYWLMLISMGVMGIFTGIYYRRVTQEAHRQELKTFFEGLKTAKKCEVQVIFTGVKCPRCGADLLGDDNES